MKKMNEIDEIYSLQIDAARYRAIRTLLCMDKKDEEKIISKIKEYRKDIVDNTIFDEFADSVLLALSL